MKLLNGFIVSDVDGTLIYKNQHLNKAGLKKMLALSKKKQIPFAVASGRTYTELQKIFKGFENDLIFICFNGALCVCGGNVLFSHPIDRQHIRSFFDNFSRSSDTCAIEFCGMSKSFMFSDFYSVLAKERAKFGENLKIIQNFDQIDEKIYKICLFKNRSQKIFEQEGLYISYFSDNLCEFVRENVSKYFSVEELCSSISVPMNKVTAFGDSENDRTLLENAGVSYTTYCAEKGIFKLTKLHTRDCIGTITRLLHENF